ncbi:hypothetical protein EXN66_Car005512 [Channa argus]|uniref:Uncharacterized protein n=1 Tax=Channa argus TaxID=215402 RepID=A0A6G1PHQ7_CHAAH|nr:hypothetical protein EXN66_Car005512 [Channa argus]
MCLKQLNDSSPLGLKFKIIIRTKDVISLNITDGMNVNQRSLTMSDWHVAVCFKDKKNSK